MLAKELKIKTLKQQREFIKEQLKQIPAGRKDGDTSYRYVGYIHPEVIEYFENEGFVVTRIKSDLLTAMAKGLPVYLFTVGNIKLTEEELKQAEEYEAETEDDDDADDEDVVDDLIKELLDRGPHMAIGLS